MSAPGRIRLNILLDEEASSELEALSNELRRDIFPQRRPFVAHHAIRLGLAQLRREGILNFVSEGDGPLLNFLSKRPPVEAPPPEGGGPPVVNLGDWRNKAKGE